MSGYATNIVLFHEPPFSLLLAGSKWKCYKFRKDRHLRKDTINVWSKRSFEKLDPAECRITLGPDFYKNPLYYDKDWMRFYRQVIDLPEATERWLEHEVGLNDTAAKKKKRGEAPE